MNDLISYKGIIEFQPENKTKKHQAQSDWKRLALILFDGDIAEYYSWFIKKRFNLKLNPPLRGAHISVINDSVRDFSEESFETAKKIYDGKEVKITFNISPRSDGKYWWINIHNETPLNEIRREAGLGKPFWKYHLTLGYANEKNISHSQYILDSIRKGFIT